MKRYLAAALLSACLAFGSAIAAELGDADSFGRNVRYLGLAQIPPLDLLPACGAPAPGTRCIPLLAPPAVTRFSLPNLARIDLPARATNSLLCLSLTPFVNFELANTTGVFQPSAQFDLTAVVTVESPVLADPALVDAATGAPFAGRIVVPLSSYREARSLAVDERAFKRMVLSRDCVGGVISRRDLIENRGLSATLATRVFQQPITLRFGAEGHAQLVSQASAFYGVRVYGD